MNSARQKPLIVLLEPNKANFRYLQEILLRNNYNVQGVSDLSEAIKKTIELSPDIILCNSVLPEFDGFHIYNLLENSIFKTGIPFVIIMEKFDQLEIEYGLELGIDNFIFKPFLEKRIIKKVNTLLHKVNQHKAIYIEKFERLFEDSQNAIALLRNNKIQKINSAFHALINYTESESKIKEIEEYFELNENSKNLFSRCLKGLDAKCILKEVAVKNSDLIVDMYVSHIGRGVNTRILIQFVEPNLDSQKLTEESFDWPINKYLKRVPCETNLGIDQNEKLYSENLTTREIEITTLSAKGYQIKEIANELGISGRTVEKHRSNIMRKTGATNIIEAISKVAESNV